MFEKKEKVLQKSYYMLLENYLKIEAICSVLFEKGIITEEEFVYKKDKLVKEKIQELRDFYDLS